MKVIYYLPSISFFSKSPYGRAAHAIGVINGLIKNDVEVLVIAEEGIKQFQSEIDARVDFYYLEPYSIKAHFDLLSKIDKIDADVFLYRKSIMGLVWMLFFHLKKYRRDKIVVSEVNGLFFDFQQRFRGSLFPLIGNLVHRLLLRFDDLVYVVDEDLKKRLSEGLFCIKDSKIAVINNAGPESEVVTVKSGQWLNLLYYGVLSDYNEMELFIDWMNRNTEAKVKLHIVGDGTERESWEKMSVGNSNIIFYGYKKREEFKRLVCSIEGNIVGIAPYTMGTNTGFFAPIKGYYYMSMGFPVLYSDLCYKNVLQDGVHGRCYVNGDKDSLNEGILDFKKPEKYLSLRDNVIRDYERFTWRKSIEQLVSEINQIKGK